MAMITAEQAAQAINAFALAHEFEDRTSADEVRRQAGASQASSFDVETAHYFWGVEVDLLDRASVVDCLWRYKFASAAQLPVEQHLDRLPARDMDGSHFSLDPTPDEEAAARDEQVRWSRLTPEQQLLELVEEARALLALDSEACAGCGCTPGQGLTPACTHPEGCGYFRDLEH